jgi:hypothetical protein
LKDDEVLSALGILLGVWFGLWANSHNPSEYWIVTIYDKRRERLIIEDDLGKIIEAEIKIMILR